MNLNLKCKIPSLIVIILPTLEKSSIYMAKKLLDQLRDVIRFKHYSVRTEESYVDWVRRYILFHDKRHPEDMGAPEIQAFLSHLATTRNVAASTWE